MKANELREKDNKEILLEKERIVKELYDLRFKKVLGVVENPLKARTLKREVARINTILQERKIVEMENKLK